jgi:hypothetical protein
MPTLSKWFRVLLLMVQLFVELLIYRHRLEKIRRVPGMMKISVEWFKR